MADSSARRFTDAATGDSTVIGQGIHVKGEITGSASIEIWGSLEGKAGTEGLLWVREGGKVQGEVAASNVVVEGTVRGKIHAQDKAELRSKCKVEGDLAAKTIAIAEGSFFEGRIQMSGKAPGSPPQMFQEKRDQPEGAKKPG